MEELFNRYGILFYVAWNFAMQIAKEKQQYLFCQVNDDGSLTQMVTERVEEENRAMIQATIFLSLGLSFIVVSPSGTRDFTKPRGPSSPTSPTQIEDAQAR